MPKPTYPLTLPANPSPSSSTFGIKRKASISESPYTGHSQSYEYDYALWGGTITLPPMREEEAREWTAFLTKLHGGAGTFLIGDPDAKQPLGGAKDLSGTFTVQADAALGAYDLTLAFTSTLPSQAGLFRAGDYIQIGAGASAKLYMIVNTTSAPNASGYLEVQIEPPLKAAVTATTTVSITSPRAVCRLTSNDVQWSANHVSTYGISLSFKEALS